MSKPGRYSKVSRRKWVDEKIRRMRPPPPSGFTLFDRFLTGPELTNVPGLFPAREVGLADALSWDLEAFREAFREVFREGLAEADWGAGLVWVPNAIRHNEPESPNVVQSWEVTLADLPDCPLKDKAFRVLEAWCKAKGEAWAKAWAKASPKPSGNQEQEQEQIQEQEGETRAPTEPEPPATSESISGPKRTPDRFRSSFVDSAAPDQIEFTDAHRAFEANGIDLQEAWLQCRDYRRANNHTREDWCAEFLSWLRREAKFRREGGKRPPRPPPQPNDPNNRYVPERVIT